MWWTKLNGTEPKGQRCLPWLPCVARLGLRLCWLLWTIALSKVCYSQQGPHSLFTGSLHQPCLPCCSSFWPSGEGFHSLCSHLFALPEILIQPSKSHHTTETSQFLCISLDQSKASGAQQNWGAGVQDGHLAPGRQGRLSHCSQSRESPLQNRTTLC